MWHSSRCDSSQQESPKQKDQMTLRKNGSPLAQRVGYAARLAVQGVLTVALVALDVVKSATGGGNSSSAFTGVVLPWKGTTTLPPAASEDKDPIKRRRARTRTN